MKTQKCIRFVSGKTLALAIAAVLPLFAAREVPAQPSAPTTPAVPEANLPRDWWVKADWTDNGAKLTDVQFDGLPISEIVRLLKDEFTKRTPGGHVPFDVVLPNAWEGSVASPGLPAQPVEARDWLSTPVSLRLKDVTVTEIFSAMNIYFEINQTPLRWELTANGSRPTVVLRVIVPQPAPVPPQPPAEQNRSVVFVGDLIGDGKSGSVPMTMEQIVNTVSQVYQLTFHRAPDQVIQCHKDAQLLVLTGSRDEINVIVQTLNSLKERKDYLNHRQTESRAEDTKAPSGAKTP